MKRNKIIALITLIAILITSVAILASCGGQATSADIPAETFGEITWEYKEKTLFITGTGSTPAKMGTFANGKDTPWYKKSATIRNSVEKVVLTNVSEVSDYAFFSFTKLSSIDFGTNTTVIGKCAFAFCNLLTEVTIPEGVTTIGESAFEGCAALSKINLPSTLTSLGERSLAYTQNLKTITVVPNTFNALPIEQYVAAYEVGKTSFPNVVSNDPADAPTTPETDAPAETDTPAETDAPEATDAPETEPAEPKNMTTTIIAIVVLAVVIVGIVVGAILLMRSNKNQKKDALTVRKNKDEKDSKKDNKKDNKKKSSKKKK